MASRVLKKIARENVNGDAFASRCGTQSVEKSDRGDILKFVTFRDNHYFSVLGTEEAAKMLLFIYLFIYLLSSCTH